MFFLVANLWFFPQTNKHFLMFSTNVLGFSVNRQPHFWIDKNQ
jgi:hypothetical protein